MNSVVHDDCNFYEALAFEEVYELEPWTSDFQDQIVESRVDVNLKSIFGLLNPKRDNQSNLNLKL